MHEGWMHEGVTTATTTISTSMGARHVCGEGAGCMLCFLPTPPRSNPMNE